jgi:hypothetical protein
MEDGYTLSHYNIRTESNLIATLRSTTGRAVTSVSIKTNVLAVFKALVSSHPKTQTKAVGLSHAHVASKLASFCTGTQVAEAIKSLVKEGKLQGTRDGNYIYHVKPRGV